MNKIILIGRLTRDPEMKLLEDSGKTITRFTLAVDRNFKNSSGEREVDFIPVVLWGKKGEIVSEYMVKGKLLSVSGRLQTGSYEDKEGHKRYIAEVVADDFQFIDFRKQEENIG